MPSTTHAIAPVALALGCAGPDPVRVEIGSGQAAAFAPRLEIPSIEADPQVDVAIGWGALTGDPLGFAVGPVSEVTLTGFRGIDGDTVTAGLVDGTLGQDRVWVQFTCRPAGQTCAFSDFEVGGHDFELADWFGAEEAVWLLALRGDGAPRTRTLALLEPALGTGSSEVALEGRAARLLLEDVRPGAPTILPAGQDVLLDWSSLLDDPALGDPDTAALARFDADPGAVAAGIEADGFSGGEVSWLDVSDRAEAAISAFGLDAGLEAGRTGALVLLDADRWLPVPALVALLEPD